MSFTLRTKILSSRIDTTSNEAMLNVVDSVCHCKPLVKIVSEVQVAGNKLNYVVFRMF